MSLSCPSMRQWHEGVPLSSRGPVAVGFAVLLFCVVGFGVWAGVAPLEGAVVATGTFVATGQNKQIQHLEGGILQDILVREGEIVDEGRTLVRLDATAATARLRRLSVRRIRLMATRARLEAEIYGKPRIETPKALAHLGDDPEVSAILDRQRVELEAKRATLTGEQEVLRKEIAGLRESISGYDARVKSTKDRIALFREELTDKSALLEKQLTRKSDVLAIERAEAGLSGELGELIGRIADSRERIARAEQQIQSLRATAVQRAITELRETETELDDVEEQIRAATDIVNRIEIKALVRGAVVKINQHTRGGVVAPGAVILELLPLNEELVIEARVKPNQITHVKEGKNALVRLSARNQRLTPMIDGRVIYVSADTVPENATVGTPASRPAASSDSYVIRVQLSPEDVRAHAADFQPAPGMPADVFVKTQDRTFFDYIMTPVFESFSRAFREQ
jgi:HlyD family type I secretion membrane fusion protein